MSLAERAKQRPEPRRNRRQKCTVQLVLEQLPAEEAEGLATMLADPKVWPGAEIARALIEEGVVDRPVKGSTIQRHRRGDCSCDDRSAA